MQEIKHVEANNPIYFTKDYSRFKSITGNRLLNENKINKIITEIKNGFDMLRYCPIIVDDEMNVIDGQHRLYIARKIKSNIYYVIVKDNSITLNHIAKLNTNTERWKNKDFMHCYIVQGNTHYEKLNDFVKKNGFDISTSASLLRGKVQDSSSMNRELFESGKFEVTHEMQAEEIAFEVNKFKDFSAYNGRPFIVAIAKLKLGGKCDIDELKRKYEQCKDLLTTQGNYKGYLKVLEDVYNFHRSKRIVIY